MSTHEPLRVHLIRHGETAWSLSGQYTGRTDIPLTQHGEEAACALGKRLRGIPFARVLASPLMRALQTCALAGLQAAAVVNPDLTEWDHGDFEGHTPVEVHAGHPHWNLFLDGAPGGESPAQIALRADQLIAQLRLLKGNVALFTHSHFGRVFAARWIKLSVAQAQHFLLNTASLSILCFEHGNMNQPAIELWNSTGLNPSE
jgi:probable phosphoglycerate mutase